ncbi:transposase family Tnp2 protein [Rhizoctonia solani AG-3 Rhs1AP]|uniref:Transposase family Tnp2 protein n=1 Tax=Rhizoctonia solani AG-3 Rhs1AP TaxID=1086054 RepID=X8JAT4_9AGAM|nr:transposase family Tnp2 protein [Rhizoctonia solani AG-3 Rhs1AP]
MSQTGDAPLSLVRLPFGISLGVGADGYQVFKGKFAAAGSYSANGIYIVFNNLPFYLRNLTENIILVLVLPGPCEPKGYAFDQMVEPLVNDLIQLARGMELPVYDSETGQIQRRQVYANLSLLIVNWIARIKCTGHVGVTAEENHCPYCKIWQCELATPQGYQSDFYELRDPIEHLQDKHRWLRAPEVEREAIRRETGTSWTKFDRVPGFYAFNNSPVDAMHLLDLGVTASIARTIIYRHGMLRKRFRGQADEDSPEARFNSFLARTIYPHHCSRIPTQANAMDGRTKAEQWRLLRLVMPVAYFEAWREGNVIPDGATPHGGRNTLHFKAQERSARQLLRRRRNVHHMFDGDPDELPQIEDCASSHNPRQYYANILRFCVGSTLLTRHQVTLAEVHQGADLIEQVGMVFNEMNVHLTPSFHAATHLPDHIRKYGNIYNTLTARFERVNRLLANVNTNGHGKGVLEATMTKGFLRRTECYRYVSELQSIEEPTDDDIRTTEVLLEAMRNGPEHEVQRGMLDAVLAGEVPMHGQEEIRLATAPAQVNFREKHREYYQLMVNFCNHHRPEALRGVVFYGFGGAPDEGELQVHIRSKRSTLSYPHFRRRGIRYGSANHHRGLRSRYGYIHGRVPVLIQGIYETTVEVRDQEYKFLAIMVQRFVPPDEEPAFPWNHWNDTLGIDAWLYGRLARVEAVLPTIFTGVFALSDITMPDGHFWITIAMVNVSFSLIRLLV